MNIFCFSVIIDYTNLRLKFKILYFWGGFFLSKEYWSNELIDINLFNNFLTKINSLKNFNKITYVFSSDMDVLEDFLINNNISFFEFYISVLSLYLSRTSRSEGIIFIKKIKFKKYFYNKNYINTTNI